MKYWLKHKDADVLSFDLCTVQKPTSYRGISNVHIVHDMKVPVVDMLDSDLSASALETWIERRLDLDDSERDYERFSAISKFLQKKQQWDFFSPIEFGSGLSMNDCYWFVSDDKHQSALWKDVSPYSNAVSEDIFNIWFMNASTSRSLREPIVDFTTHGRSRKAWRTLSSDDVRLYKLQTVKQLAVGGREAYSDFYISQIAELFPFDSVRYNLEQIDGKLFSVCKAFTSEEVGYMPFQQYLDSLGKFKKNRSYILDRIHELYSSELFEDMMVFDALVCNANRDLSAFGMLIDNNTLKQIKPAPVYGFSRTFFDFIGEDEDQDVVEPLSVEEALTKIGAASSLLGDSFDEQLETYVKERHIPLLEKLLEFKFKKHDQYNLSDKWLEVGAQFVQQRAYEALDVVG